MCTALNAANIETVLVSDAAVCAVMGRVNKVCAAASVAGAVAAHMPRFKVIIGTHTVIGDGGLMSINGTHAVALAAKHYSVPVVVLAQFYKLSPLYLCAYDQDTFNNLQNPNEVLEYAAGEHLGGQSGRVTDERACVHAGELVGDASVQNPAYDYVPPELITLFISNGCVVECIVMSRR
jgi:translation initiation factor eIF-2B subunit beta